MSCSDVTPGNKEQEKGSPATISCKVTGLTTVLDGVKWKKSDNTEITSVVGSFVIDTGKLSGDTQTTTLTVPASQTDQDKSYNCLIISNEHRAIEKSTTVNLKVFCE